jgi:thioredoxin 1
MTITPIQSEAQFRQLLNTNTYVVADFYADWCSPCKAIAPVFANLATAEAKPGRLAFVKIDVDGQPGLARQYGVSA